MKEKEALGSSIHLYQVTRTYSEKDFIFKDLDLKIEAGEFVSILGPSGCGKSTLLRMMAALDQPNSGSIEFGPKDLSPVRGFVFQEPRLLPWRSVLQNVMLPLELQKHPSAEAKKKALQAIEKVGLSDALHKFPGELSGGMKMRTSVARALVFRPSLLLLDEPFSALDEHSRNTLQDDLRTLWQTSKLTIVFVTHSIQEAVYLSNRTIVLSRRPSTILVDREIDLPNKRTSKLRLETQFTHELKAIHPFLTPQKESL